MCSLSLFLSDDQSPAAASSAYAYTSEGGEEGEQQEEKEEAAAERTQHTCCQTPAPRARLPQETQPYTTLWWRCPFSCESTHTILHTYLLALTYSHIFQSRVEINGKVRKTPPKLNMWLQYPCNEFLDVFVNTFFLFIFFSLITFLIIWMENLFNPLMHTITP